MAVPKSKISHMRRGQRNSHSALSVVRSRECPNCGEPSLPHHLCAACGVYRSREVVPSQDS